MSFTVHSHCLDTAKHCALLHIIVEQFHFMMVATGVKKEDGNSHGIVMSVVFIYRADSDKSNRTTF